MTWRTASVLLAVAAACAGPPRGAQAQSWRTVTMSRQVAGESPLDVQVEYAAGRFRVRAGDPETLYRMQLRYDEGRFEPRAEYDEGHLRLGMTPLGRSGRVGRNHGGELDLDLAPGVPMSLDLAFGAVRADLDLGGLSITELSVATGASESTIDVSTPNPVEMGLASLEVGASDFSARRLGNLNASEIRLSAGVGDILVDLTGEWRRDARVRVDVGVGVLELRLPEGVGVRLTRDTFLTAFEAHDLVRRGDAWYSPEWDDATVRLEVELDVDFGSVEVVRVR